ncbi:Mce family protein [Gordonia effusa NBRC 100432]|uniref:Mce family protein n=2 Tax=Gordonia effusa TaxID=263908 RepID=H0QWF8_9ACTN|nr:Mce family protein [Gordonia effusa NBRC 100432]
MNPVMRIRRQLSLMVSILIGIAALGGCTFNPANHAMPGSGVDGPTYRVHIEFESVLNLPIGAAVMVNGNKVGTVQSVELGRDAVIAETDITDSVRLPSATRAELRQTTMLGDVYLALVPVGGGAELADGAKIPLAQTDPGVQVEEMLERIATFASGGSILRLQRSLDQLGRAVAMNPATTRALASSVARNLDGAARRTGDIGRMLGGMDHLTQTMLAMRPTIEFVFSDAAGLRLSRMPIFIKSVLNLIIDLETLTSGIEWLLPSLPTINMFLEKTSSVLRNKSAHAYQYNGPINDMISLVRNKVIPYLTGGPSVNISMLHIQGNGGDSTKDALVILRMAGLVK